MKATSQSRTSILSLFADFPSPSFFANPFSLERHSYKKKDEDEYFFVKQLLSESKQRTLYRSLEALFHNGLEQLENQKLEGAIEEDLHPLKEQSWFVLFLKNKVSHLRAHELWLIMLQHEQREKYAKFFDEGEDIDAFELFLQNYFFNALSFDQLKDVLFIIQNTPPEDQKSYMEKFFQCLSVAQGKALFEGMKHIQMPYTHWKTLCLDSLAVMRNAQIVVSMTYFPTELAPNALSRLYPQEAVEVIVDEKDQEKRRLFTEKALESYKKWWGSFCHQEIKLTIDFLKQLDA